MLAKRRRNCDERRADVRVMREFYHDGIPDGVVSRDVEYAEKLRAV